MSKYSGGGKPNGYRPGMVRLSERRTSDRPLVQPKPGYSGVSTNRGNGDKGR
mgnify:CR=1 FL=1